MMIKMRIRVCVDMPVAPGSVSPRYGRGRTQGLEPDPHTVLDHARRPAW